MKRSSLPRTPSASPVAVSAWAMVQPSRRVESFPVSGVVPARGRYRFVLLGAIVAAFVLAPGRAHAYSNYGYKWKELGPAPVCCMFPSPTTGRATAVAVNPLNKDDVWVGTAGGGVWHSIDGGQSWKPMSDNQESLAVGAIAVAGCTATSCSTIYAGTGENASRRDTYHGAGLLVGSFDGSTISWAMRTGYPYNFKYGSIYSIVLGPVSEFGQTIYVALSSGVTASASESTVTAPEPVGGYGIYKTLNGGSTWTKVLDVGKPTDLELDRTSNQVLYAGILGKGIFKTTDAGGLWCPLNPGNPLPNGCNAATGLPNGTAPPPPNNPNAFVYDHVEIATDPTLPQPQSHLFATFGRCPDPLVDECEPALYESTNGGSTWTQRYVGSSGPWTDIYSIAPCPYAYSRYTHSLTIDPSDPGKVLLGGLRLCKWKLGSGWTTTDTDFGNYSPYGNLTHLDHHAVVFAPSDPLRVYNAHDGGLSVSSNGGQTWDGANGGAPAGGLGVIGFQSIAASPFTPNVIGGTQDNSGMLWSGAMLWDHLPCCGDGGFSVMEHDTAPGKSDDMFVTSNVGGVTPIIDLPIRSLNGGSSFDKPPTSYNLGIPNDHQRSFYSPLLEHPTTFDLYFGTHTLFKSTDASTNYAAISPKLSSNTVSGIVGGKDVITAIAVAPSNPSRVYLGYFSGRTFHSNSPCNTAACWPEGTTLPGPVTWIAVHPTLDALAYATVSGFGAGGHVYKTTTGGVGWNVLPSTPGMTGVPANTVFIEPTVPDRVWVGNDNGIYRSSNGGSSWAKYSKGLPNVPVYAFARNKDKALVAATHGRGAWTLTTYAIAPTGTTPVGSIVYNAAALAQGFAANQSCELAIVRQDGTVCASGPNDALGGVVSTDERGFLVSSKPGFFSRTPVVWACAQGRCLDRDVMDCNQRNRMAFLQVSCGGQVARSAIEPEAPAPDPPGTTLGLAWLDPSGGGGAPPTVNGSFTIVPAVQSSDGSTRRLCSSVIAVSPGDTAASVLQRAVAAINDDPICRLAGVQAGFDSAIPGPGGEDRFPGQDRLVLQAPLLTGSRLVPAVRTGAGAATGLCFRMGGLKHVSETAGLRVRFTTPATGAHGGPLHVVEQSPLGRCEIVATIPAGAPGTGVAQAVAGAFQAPDAGTPHPGCPSRVNPRDVTQQGDSVRAAFASGMEVCLDDAAVGVSIAPEEICFAAADCDDGNPCTTDACDPITAQCSHAAAPDGTPCADADLCTTGLTCSSGVCGTRLVCDDGNRCTADACNPATGGCVSTPVVCEDGNACTQDTCNAGTGQCVFAPLPTGSTCDDGDPCSTADVCVPETGLPAPVCRGSAVCDDSDPCTSDHCDTDDGACVFLPIQCDDGNPCTIDQCQAGVCQSSGVAGVACDDGDLCTTGDTCTFHPTNGQFSCDGSALNCEDRDLCTVDSCDPVTGGCRHLPPAIAPVPLLDLLDNTRVGWSAAAGALAYNSYRGTIPAQMLGSRPAPRYDQVCFEAHDSAGDGAQVSTDAQTPPVGTAFYYLASEMAACGESAIGHDSNTTPIPNAAPCPP